MVSQNKTGLFEVAPGAWAMVMSIIGPNGGGPNAGFIVAGGEVLVIDALISLSAARELSAGIKKVTGKKPSFLINTHSHGDHVIGNQIFSPPATIIAHENVREAVLREGREVIDRMARLRPFLAEDLKEARVVAPEITFRDGLTFHLGDRTIELIHPGVAHTTGDTMVYLRKEKLLYSGDLLFNHIIPPMFGDSAGWISVIEQIEAMDIETIVPGHGLVCTKEEITDLKQFLSRFRGQVKKCYDRKLSKEQALAEIDMGVYGDWPHQERLGFDIEQLYREFGKAG